MSAPRFHVGRAYLARDNYAPPCPRVLGRLYPGYPDDAAIVGFSSCATRTDPGFRPGQTLGLIAPTRLLVRLTAGLARFRAVIGPLDSQLGGLGERYTGCVQVADGVTAGAILLDDLGDAAGVAGDVAGLAGVAGCGVGEMLAHHYHADRSDGLISDAVEPAGEVDTIERVAFMMGVAILGVAVEQEFGADWVEPAGEVVFQTELAAEHVAPVQAVEPPCFGGLPG